MGFFFLFFFLIRSIPQPEEAKQHVQDIVESPLKLLLLFLRFLATTSTLCRHLFHFTRTFPCSLPGGSAFLSEAPSSGLVLFGVPFIQSDIHSFLRHLIEMRGSGTGLLAKEATQQGEREKPE